MIDDGEAELAPPLRPVAQERKERAIGSMAHRKL